MYVILLGPPGVGKGTQAVRCAASLAVPQISTGDMFRAARGQDSELGLQVKDIMDRGSLVPDDVVIAVVADRLKQDDAQAGFILDGFPRTLVQAEALDEMLAALGAPLERCVALTVDEQAVVQRMLKRAGVEGRADDNEETIRERMQVYRAQTQPLLDFYEKSGKLVEVDGMGEVAEISERIQEALAA